MKGTASSIEERRAGTGTLLLLLCVAAVCAILGKWQLARAEQQRVLDARAATAQGMPALDLPATTISAGDLFRHAAAEGIYDARQQFYLEGRSHNDQPGYHVITALRLAGTRRYVLVNRGWMPGSADSAPVPAGKVRVTGVLARAQLPALRVGEPRGAVRPYLDPEEYARESGLEVAPLMLLADGDGSALVPVTPARETKLAMHIGYALQWFAFAAIAAGAAAMVTLRGIRHDA